jgi:hypothetical protein
MGVFLRHSQTFALCAFLSLGLIAGCSHPAADQAAAGTTPAVTPAAALPPGQAAASHADAAAAAAVMPADHPPAAAEAQVIEPVAPAPGGVTIAKLWADRASLAGKRVTVRGKVVKYNGAIMGLNWVHLQDGSGSAKDGTHDLTITSSTEARVGDVVTVTGTVVIDKDFGAGYAYPVMLQGATITVK